MTTSIGNAVIGQSGGPTSVINQSLVGVISEMKRAGLVKQLLGARHGVRGIVNDDFLPLLDAPDDLLERVAITPAAALGSTRDKPDQAYCEKIFQSFARHDVRYFFYIGGNDSADTARIVGELAAKEGHALRVFHVPKTIDNDLRVHDHTPGYGSAAKFVAAAIMGDNFDNRSLPGIKVDVIMGRNAGFLTAASVLARQHDDDGPHLIYVPEAPLSEEKFLADVDRVYKKLGRCLIAVSEGVSNPQGKTWVEAMSANLDKDAHGNVQLSGTGALGDYLADLITKKLQPPGGKKLRVRADTFGYLQRSFPGFTSDSDSREARLVGLQAVKYAAAGEPGGSIAMRRLAGHNYAIETFLTPLSTVARETKHMDAAYIENGNNITAAFKAYAAPLVGPLPMVGTLDALKVVKK
ncbi:MAG TPA: 6-phosphofructokinase [Tepidisphaeraceae bacterium]|jgi:6-phosphofructokinase 1|nr:6-phosphofructokinase [Tepidisphaeraceae bacterium]